MSKKREVLSRINSINSTKKITQAMKMVSISKLTKYHSKSEMLEYYSNNIYKIIEIINKNKLNSIFKHSHKGKNILIILISSDKGLCGSFNANLFKNFIEQTKHFKGNFIVLPIGKKAHSFVKKTQFPVIDNYIDLFSPFINDDINKFSNYIYEKYSNSEYSEIKVFYNKQKNSTESICSSEILLPFSFHGKKKRTMEELPALDYIIEPKSEILFKKLFPKLLNLKIYSALLKSMTAEHAARMLAMTKATDNAEELIKELKLDFNRSRQATITKEITEIVGGSEALKGQH